MIIMQKKKKRKEGKKETETSVKGKWIVTSAEFVNKSMKHLKKNKIPMKHQILLSTDYLMSLLYENLKSIE